MVVQILGGLIVAILAILIVIPLIRYRITRRWLLITILGVPVRWVSLKNIRFITDHSREWAEPWANTFSPGTRLLYLRKRHGLFRELKITPTKRFVFKAELEKAIRAADPQARFDDTQFFARPPEGASLRHHGVQS